MDNIRHVEQSILDVDGRRLYSTSSSRNKAFLEEMMARLQKDHPTVTFTIEPFFANIKTINPKTKEVTDWTKEEGFSLWYCLADSF